uniref:Uncharacterized protein n=1 Tax=Setaria viridis TaxID=4556 RepID=A0A4U6TBQ4_SETVI|nr:hypothetical protein SEVIR_8G046050v2 [Setaria viridis]
MPLPPSATTSGGRQRPAARTRSRGHPSSPDPPPLTAPARRTQPQTAGTHHGPAGCFHCPRPAATLPPTSHPRRLQPTLPNYSDMLHPRPIPPLRMSPTADWRHLRRPAKPPCRSGLPPRASL